MATCRAELPVALQMIQVMPKRLLTCRVELLEGVANMSNAKAKPCRLTSKGVLQMMWKVLQVGNPQSRVASGVANDTGHAQAKPWRLLTCRVELLEGRCKHGRCQSKALQVAEQRGVANDVQNAAGWQPAEQSCQWRCK